MAKERKFRERGERVRFLVDPRLTRFERPPVRRIFSCKCRDFHQAGKIKGSGFKKDVDFSRENF